MKKIILVLAILSSSILLAQKKALIGGTLIDGYGNIPIYDSVILIDNETITAVSYTHLRAHET